jgi:UDP-N-acetylmuramate: L-alanyl-gamma-D-glutamyl-meso-diaminopimelate ligase
MPRLVLPQSTDPAPTFDLDQVRRIHVMGVGGTGMGTFAALLKQSGYEVTGSDEGIYPPMSELLASWSIEALAGYRAENLDRARPDLVVVGNVIRRVNPEATALRERGIPYLSFPQALAELFLASRRPVVVTGTHGKTTSSALLTHVLTHAGRDPSALIGGVALNMSSPQGPGGSFRLGKGDLFVVEGDEYDTAYFDKRPKFLLYRPQVALLTSVEFDHADIYRDLDHYRSAFASFIALLPASGHLAVAHGSGDGVALAREARCPVETYGIDAGDWSARDLAFEPSGARFTPVHGGRALGTWRLPLFGRHNVENALGVAALCRHLGLEPEEIGAGLASFLGVTRRQELLGSPRGIAIVDDFAHHPTAVRETLAAIRTRYPGRRVLAIFEPRSNTSSRNIHQAEYAHAFAGAALALLAAPHRASQIAEGERLAPDQLAREIAASGTPARFVATVEGLVTEATAWAKPGDVILVMSNGSFGGLPRKLLAALE